MYLKVHRSQGKVVVAVCDKELIGKVISDGKATIDLETYKHFYVGEVVDEHAVRSALHTFNSANIVGKRAVKVCLDMGIVDEADVVYVGAVPIIQIYVV